MKIILLLVLIFISFTGLKAQEEIPFDPEKFHRTDLGFIYDKTYYNYKELGTMFKDEVDFQYWYKKSKEVRKTAHTIGAVSLGVGFFGVMAISGSCNGLSCNSIYAPLILGGLGLHISLGKLFAASNAKKKSIQALEGTLNPKFRVSQNQSSLDLKMNGNAFGLVLSF